MTVIDTIRHFPDYFFGQFANMFMVFQLVIVLPILLVTVVWWAAPKGKRLKAVAWIIAAMALLAYGDVTFNAFQSQYLCTHEAGMRVFTTAETEGIAGVVGEELLREGYRFVEWDSGVKYRESLVDGQVKRERIPEYTAEYELDMLSVPDDIPGYACCTRHLYVIRNRASGEVLGQLQKFSLSQGWVRDFLPASASPMCIGPDEPPNTRLRNDLYSGDLLKAVLRPRRAKARSP